MEFVVKKTEGHTELTIIFKSETTTVDYEWSGQFETWWYLIDPLVLREWADHWDEGSTLWFAEVLSMELQKRGIADLHEYIKGACKPQRVMNVFDGFN